MTTTEHVIELALDAGCSHVNLTGDRAMAIQRLSRLISLAKAEALAEGWELIESAPLNETVLVYPPTWPSKTCSTAQFNDDKYSKKPRPYWEREDALGLVNKSRLTPPTHWRPLPPPPSMKEKA